MVWGWLGGVVKLKFYGQVWKTKYFFLVQIVVEWVVVGWMVIGCGVGRLCGGAHEISDIKAPHFLCG